MLRRLAVGVLLFAALVPAARAREGAYKVESIGALTETSVAEGVRGALAAQGLRVTQDGKPLLEIWFRKEIPVTGSEAQGALFSKIPAGAFAGVIRFTGAAGDFRGQPIKAGYYTLRYAIMLEDGNHLGVAPSRDFFIISPIDLDKDPSLTPKSEDLFKLGRAAAGTGHPSVWSLVVPADAKNLPRVTTNEHEHVILETTLTTKSGPLAIGLIIVGKTEG
jgi:hypothetical protein